MPTEADSHEPGEFTTGWPEREYSSTSATWSHPGKGHDRALIAERFAGVADGATPLGPDWADPGPFAEQALAELRRFAVRGRRPAPQVFADAIRATQTTGTTGTTEAPEAKGANCAVAVMWIDAPDELDATHVNVGVLGDCLALIETVDGTTRVLTDPAVSRLDELVAKAEPEHRLALLRENRARANTVNGYWIYADNPEAADHILWTRMPLAQVRTIFLGTDGLKRVPALREGFANQAMPAPGPAVLTQIVDSVRTRRLDGLDAGDTDDEAAVLITIGHSK
jgi:hypothetical protein